MKKEQILGFNLITYNSEELIDKIFQDYQNNEKLFIVNINPEIAVANYKNEKFKEKLNKEKYQIPDGSGIVWASKKKKGSIKERITGIDLMDKICEKSQQYSSNIYLYGGKEGIAEKAKENLQKKYPNIKIIGTHHGYDNEEIIVDELSKLPVDILFVGLGSPKQEEFILQNREKLKNIKIFMPVGGSFDVISGMKKRAPKWMINCNLEWLYRTLQEPKRFFRQCDTFIMSIYSSIYILV